MIKHKTWLLAALLAAGAAAQGQAPEQGVYRCGDSYSQQPCAGGKRVDAADPRSAEQRAQANAAAQRDAKAADAMEKARLQQEARAAPAVIPPPRPEPVATQEKPKLFTATVPKPPRAKATRKPSGKSNRKAADKERRKTKTNAQGQPL